MIKLLLAILLLSGQAWANTSSGWYGTLQGNNSDVQSGLIPNGSTLQYNSSTSQWTFSYANVPAGGSTGYVLTKNSGSDYDYSWQASSGGGGGGNVGIGTTGRISVYLNSTTIGSPYNINVDIGGNVGIGSTSPGQALDVQGTVRMTGFNLPGTNNNYVLTSDASGNGTWQVASGGSNIGIGTANTITFWPTTSTIGSLPTATYPSLTELSYSKGVTSAIQTQIGTKAPSTSGSTSLQGNGSGGFTNVSLGATGVIGLNSSNQIVAGSGFISSNPSLDTVLGVGATSTKAITVGTEIVNGTGLTVNGNVGIPTTTVSGNLTLVSSQFLGTGNANIGIGTITTTNFTMNKGVNAGYVMVGSSVGLGTWMPSTTLNTPIVLTTTGTSGASTLTGNALNIPQYTGGTGTNYWINSGQTVGIGTIYPVGIGTWIPNATLDVEGTQSVASFAGNIGVGTWLPAYAIDAHAGTIGGGQLALAGVSTGGSLALYDPTNTYFTQFDNNQTTTLNTYYHVPTVQATNGQVLGWQTGNNLLWVNQTGSNYWLNFPNVGIGTYSNVGIGTSSTNLNLIVQNNIGIGTWVGCSAAGCNAGNGALTILETSQPGLLIKGKTGINNNNADFVIESSTATGSWDFQANDGSLSGGSIVAGALSIYDQVGQHNVLKFEPGAPTNTLIMKASGNIGIGTFAPVDTLDVAGGIRLGGNLAGGTTGNIGIGTAQTATGATCDSKCNNNNQRCMFGIVKTTAAIEPCSVSIIGDCACLPAT